MVTVTPHLPHRLSIQRPYMLRAALLAAVVLAMPIVASSAEPPLMLIRKLSTANQDDRTAALRELEAELTKDVDRVAVKALVGLLRTNDTGLQADVADILEKAARKQPAAFAGAVPDLAAVIPSLGGGARFQAIHLLGFLGTRAREASKMLRSFSAGEQDASIFERAYSAAVPIRTDPDDRDAIKLLCDLSRSSKQSEACTVLAALIFSESKSESVITVFRDKISDGDAGVRTMAANGLWRTGASPAEVVPLLRDALREKPATPVNTRPLTSFSGWIPTQRTIAADVIRQIGAEAKAAVPELLSLLGSDDYADQIVAATALGAIGSGARPAATALRKLAMEATGDLQKAAKLALSRIMDNES